MAASTLTCPVAGGSARWPDHPACVTPHGEMSYAEFGQRVGGLCSALRLRGVSAGSRVGLMIEASADALALHFALPRIGAVACPISARLPESEAAGQMNRIGAHSVIVDRDHTFDVPAMAVGDVVADARPGEDDAAGTEIPREQPVTIIHTSGSTAVSTAVVHPCRAHYYSALGANENLPLGPGNRWLLSLPLYHVGGIGILWRCMLAGSAVVVPGRQELLSDAIARYAVTHLSLVCTQLYRLLREDPESMDGLDAVLVGGGPVCAELIDLAASHGISVYPTYGLTEMSSQVATVAPSDPVERRHTSGRVLRYRQAQVSHDGEILVRGETLYSGVATAEGLDPPQLDSDGWYATGDLGSMDAEGYLTVDGRRDNMFISGGENIQPEAIEAALLRLPAVVSATVVPVSDEEFGRRPVAFVEFAGGASPGQLAGELEKRLPRFMIPTAFYPYPEGSEGAVKVSRTELREMAARIAG